MQLTESLATFPRDRDNGSTDAVRGYHGEVIQNTPSHNISGAHMESVLIKSVYLTVFRGHNSINKTVDTFTMHKTSKITKPRATLCVFSHAKIEITSSKVSTVASVMRDK